MEVDVDRLTPGMILEKDVLGKSGNPIVEKHTKLTETHIEFIKHFLFDKVSVAPIVHHSVDKITATEKQQIALNQDNQLFTNTFEKAVQHYKKLFSSWQNNVPINMYLVRKFFVPLFDEASELNIDKIISLLPTSNTKDYFYKRTVLMSLLSVYLAKKLNFKKKDWLQIGLASILSDCGISKLKGLSKGKNIPEETMRLHPIYSYRMVENEPTLTQHAKIAILQHHEYLDGSGYPANTSGKKVIVYARIINVCDLFLSVYSNNHKEIISVLEDYKHNKLDPIIVQQLVSELCRDSE